MSAFNFPDDSSEVNAHGTLPVRWVQGGMLLLNLAVWIGTAIRVAG